MTTASPETGKPVVNDDLCKHPQGRFRPVVDQARCEAKGPCVEVCPYDVFEIRKIERSDYARLGLMGKVKSFVHGGRVSYTPNADQCRGCGLCVKACPEHAITMVRTEQR